MKRILIIDDERPVAEALKRFVEADGRYKVSVENGGWAGLRAARRRQPDLILLDILMPDLDGYEVLKHLKKSDKTSRIPVIILTALNTEDARDESFYWYAEQYLTKPVEREDLLDAIDRVLHRQI